MPVIELASAIAAFSYLSNQAVDALKPYLALHTSQIPGRTVYVRLLTITVTAVIATVGTLLLEYAGFLPADSLIPVLVGVFPALGAWYQIDSRRRQHG